jgi:hypothetical protein
MRPVNSSMMTTFAVVLDDVVAVLLEQLVRAQRLVDVVDERDVGGVVEPAFGQDAVPAEPAFDGFVAGLGQRDRAVLFVELVMLFLQLRDEASSIAL